MKRRRLATVQRLAEVIYLSDHRVPRGLYPDGMAPLKAALAEPGVVIAVPFQVSMGARTPTIRERDPRKRSTSKQIRAVYDEETRKGARRGLL